MAGDWLKMRCDLRDRPKVVRLAEKLGQDELYVIGALWAFWKWVDAYAVDGHVDGATARVIDKATRVEGLAEAICSVKWLKIDENGATIPDFEEHNGETSKERTLKNQRQARWRGRKAAGLIDADKDGAPSTPPSTPPSTHASTREEKRREEKKEPRSKALSPADAVEGKIPVNGHNGHDLLGKIDPEKSTEAEASERHPTQ